MTSPETDKQHGRIHDAIESIPGREQLEKLMGNKWFWISAAIATASGVVGIATWKFLRDKYRQSALSKETPEGEIEGLIEGLEAELEVKAQEPYQENPLFRRKKEPLATRWSLSAALLGRALRPFQREKGVDLRGFYRAVGHPLRTVRSGIQGVKDVLRRDPNLSFAGVDPKELRELHHFFSGVEVTAQSLLTEHTERALRERYVKEGYSAVPAPKKNHRDWQEFKRIMEAGWPFPSLRNIRHGIVGDEFTGPESLLFPDGVLFVRRGGQMVGYVTFIAVDADFSQIDLANFSLQDALQRRVNYLQGANIMVTSATKDKDASLDVIGVGLLALVELAREEQALGIEAPALSPYPARKQRRQGGEYSKAWFSDGWLKTGKDGLPKDEWRQVLLSLALDSGPVNPNFIEFPVSLEELSSFLSDKERLQLVSRGVVYPKASHVPILQEDGQYECVVPAGWVTFDDGRLWRWTPDERLKLLKPRVRLVDD